MLLRKAGRNAGIEIFPVGHCMCSRVTGRSNSNWCPNVRFRTTAGATYDFPRPHRPAANVDRSSSSSRMGHRRSRGRRADRGGNRICDEPEPSIIDSKRPQPHAISAQQHRPGRRGKHRSGTVTELVGLAEQRRRNSLCGCWAMNDRQMGRSRLHYANWTSLTALTPSSSW